MSNSLLSPLQKFVRIESFGGILLLVATAVAMVWANSPLQDTYDSFWQYQIGIKSFDIDLVKPLRLWVNDGLMAIFFFLIGLEIKRELLIGELNSVRKATFPFLAAFGGMVVPVILFLKSGIHPTIAGVMLAFTVPIRQRTDLRTFTENLGEIIGVLQTCPDNTKPVLTHRQIEIIDNLEDWTSKVQSPLQHLEHKLHNLVAWLIMPIFALANAGVVIGGNISPEVPLLSNLAISLVLGKSLGITLITYAGLKLKWIELPTGVTMGQIIGVSFLAGVGFTMSIFIANLAFTGNPLFADSAKLGILLGSVIAGTLGYVILHIQKR